MLIDTHSHIYSEEFDADRDEVMQRAKAAGIQKIILPNVDSRSLPRMLCMESDYPGYCFAAIGLHPTSVDSNFAQELLVVEQELQRQRFIAVGEIGIDLYWDKTHYGNQVIAFQQQVEWALAYDIPVIIHVRNSHRETIRALNPFRRKGLRGVFHCFTGTSSEAEEVFAVGDFKLGIGGVVTFKNATLGNHLRTVPLEKIVLETDAPYLAPTPLRGKRNEPAYMSLVCNKLAEIYGTSPEEVARITTDNAEALFF